MLRQILGTRVLSADGVTNERAEQKNSRVVENNDEAAISHQPPETALATSSNEVVVVTKTEEAVETAAVEEVSERGCEEVQAASKKPLPMGPTQSPLQQYRQQFAGTPMSSTASPVAQSAAAISPQVLEHTAKTEKTEPSYCDEAPSLPAAAPGSPEKEQQVRQAQAPLPDGSLPVPSRPTLLLC